MATANRRSIRQTVISVLIIDSGYAEALCFVWRRSSGCLPYSVKWSQPASIVSARQYKDAVAAIIFRCAFAGIKVRVYHEDIGWFLFQDPDPMNFLQLFPRQRGAKIW